MVMTENVVLPAETANRLFDEWGGSKDEHVIDGFVHEDIQDTGERQDECTLCNFVIRRVSDGQLFSAVFLEPLHTDLRSLYMYKNDVTFTPVTKTEILVTVTKVVYKPTM
jgi:hypothetical protein